MTLAPTVTSYAEILQQFDGKEGDLIPILQQIQEQYGYIPEDSLPQIANFLKITENRIFGVASFYSQFQFIPPGRHSIKVCMGTACHVKGGQILLEAVERELEIQPGETTPDGRFDLQRVACLGCCALAPVIKINEDVHSQVKIAALPDILQKYE